MMDRLFKKSEEGSISPLTMAIVAAMLVLSGITVDLAIAGAQQQIQSNDLAAAHDDMMSAPVALQLKNSDNPGLFCARTVAGSLRENGYDGKVTVWYYEAASSQVPASKRAMAWAVQTETAMPSLFLRFSGFDELPVGSFTVGSMMPYSLEDTWRPANRGNGVYELDAGQDPSAIRYTEAETTAEVPIDLAEALQARIDEANAS